jgi:hypothetical protein
MIGGALAAAMEHFQFAQPAFEALAAAAQRLVDRLGRGRQTPLQDGQRKADGAGALVVLQRFGAVEFLAHVAGDGPVEDGFRVGELVGYGVGDALGEERRAVELEQIFFHHPAHQIRDVGGMHAIAIAPFEAVAIEQRHEQLKIRFLAVVRRRRHQQEMPGERRQQLAEAIAPGVPGLAAEHGRRHLVRFVADHQIPAAIGRLQLLLHVFVARELVEAGDTQRGFKKPVAGARRFELVVGENLEGQVKAPVEFILPLFGQTAGADDQAALQVTADDQFLDQQAGHDRLAGAGVVRQEKAQRLARQHGFVDRGDLVRQRINERGVHRQHGIEEMRKPDALGLRHEAKERAIAVEAPRPTLLDEFEARLVVAVEQFVRHLAGSRLVGQFQRFGAKPLDADDAYQGVGNDSAECGMGLDLFEFHQGSAGGIVVLCPALQALPIRGGGRHRSLPD